MRGPEHRQDRAEFWAEAVPDPDGPITAVNECRANSALTPSSARTALWPCRYTFRTSCNATGTAGRRPAPRSSRSPAVTGCSIVISFLPAGAFRPNWHLLCMLPRRQPGPRGRAVKQVRVCHLSRPCVHAHTQNVIAEPKPPVGPLVIVDAHAAFRLTRPSQAWTRSQSRGFASSCQT